MSYLFIDSSYDLSLGVLSAELEWLALEEFSGQKSSQILQKKSYELLLKLNIPVSELKGIISVVGPGFYTGLRLAEGFSNVLSFFGIKEHTLYSYEIPAWCGYEEGTWFTKAYRGEYFLSHWKNDHRESELISVKELPVKLSSKEKFFIHSKASLDSHCENYLTDAVMTSELVKEFPQKIFKHVIGREKQEPYYFRAPEDEFKVNP